MEGEVIVSAPEDTVEFATEWNAWKAAPVLTFPVLLTLWVTLSSCADNLGRRLGISPPVACQLQSALAI